MLAGLGMGIACLISVLEFCWKSGRVESKVNVKHRKYIILIVGVRKDMTLHLLQAYLITTVPFKVLSDLIRIRYPCLSILKTDSSNCGFSAKVNC